LYYDGVRKKIAYHQKNELLQKSQEKSKMKEFTGAPQISAISKEVAR
jgi:hypothetical protein